MGRVQAVALILLLGVQLRAGEAAIGEAGLQALAEARAAVRVVEGSGTHAVRRLDDPDGPVEKRALRFAVALDGRYEIIITDPADPEGERTRLVSDGRVAKSQEWMLAGEQPLVKTLAAGPHDLLRRLLSCLRLDLAALRREYAVELRAADTGLRELRLTPTDKDVAREIALVGVFIDAAGKPVRVVLDDTSGNRRRLEIAAFADDPPLDVRRFTPP